MIDETKFSKRWTIGNKEFGLLKKPWKISENNVRETATEVERADIKANLAPNIKAIGMQQLPVVNGKGEVFIGGRRTVACEINGEPNLLVEIRDIPDVDQMIASWSENYTKRDMDAHQEGRIFKRMLEKFQLSERELAKRLGNVSKDTVNRKIRVFEDFYLSRGETVPHEKPNDSEKTFNYGKAIELLPLPKDTQTRLLSEIKTKGLSRSKLREVIKQSNAMINAAKSFDEKKQKEILEEIKPMLFKKDIKPEDVIFTINEVAGASHKTVPHKIPKEEYTTQKEADEQYFIPRGGRCLGEKTESYWYGTINKVKARELDKAEKEAKKNDQSNSS